MPSRTEIANLILSQLELPPVDSLDGDVSPKASQIRSTWDLTSKWCMAQHPWKFARGWWWRNQAPVPAAENPSAVHSLAFRKPADCMRVLQVGATPAHPKSSDPFIVEGDYICTDAASGSGPIDINGIRWTTDPGRWSVMFAWYFAFQMAWINGKPLNASEALRERAKNDRDDTLRQARSADASEQVPPPSPWPDTWLDARHHSSWEW